MTFRYTEKEITQKQVLFLWNFFSQKRSGEVRDFSRMRPRTGQLLYKLQSCLCIPQ